VAPLIAAVVFLVLGVFAAHQRANSAALYAVLAIRVWLGVLLFGIHATLAGILVALAVLSGAVSDRSP
jgi:Na+/H+ antiporter NhaA